MIGSGEPTVPANEGPLAVRDRMLRRLRLRVLLLPAVVALPGAVGPLVRHLSGGMLVRGILGEVLFVAAIVAGVLAMRRGQPIRQGSVLVAAAVLLVAAGYGVYLV